MFALPVFSYLGTYSLVMYLAKRIGSIIKKKSNSR